MTRFSMRKMMPGIKGAVLLLISAFSAGWFFMQMVASQLLQDFFEPLIVLIAGEQNTFGAYAALVTLICFSFGWAVASLVDHFWRIKN